MKYLKTDFTKGGEHFPPAPKAILLAEAVLRYDAAIASCGNDPEKMASFCTAEGEDLDKLYFDMVNAAKGIYGAEDHGRLYPPQEIIEAERKVSMWFAENNITEWELGGSRKR